MNHISKKNTTILVLLFIFQRNLDKNVYFLFAARIIDSKKHVSEQTIFSMKSLWIRHKKDCLSVQREYYKGYLFGAVFWAYWSIKLAFSICMPNCYYCSLASQRVNCGSNSGWRIGSGSMKQAKETNRYFLLSPTYYSRQLLYTYRLISIYSLILS